MAVWMRVLCAIALLCLGFAHKAPAVAASSMPPAAVSQYVLPDGTSPVLCLPDEGKRGHGDHLDLGEKCEACRLGAATLLPAPVDTVGLPIPRPADPLVLARIGTFHRQFFPPNVSSRGPPSGPVA